MNNVDLMSKNDVVFTCEWYTPPMENAFLCILCLCGGVLACPCAWNGAICIL